MASTILSDNGVSSGSAGIKTTADSTGALALQTTTAGGTATTAVTIDTSQNVGIGTASPAAKLDVAGTSQVSSSGVYLQSQVSGTDAFISMTGSGDLAFRLGSGYTQVMRILANGNVGIGTTSPGYKLDVQSSASSGAPLLANFQSAGGDPQVYISNGTVKTQITADATNSASIVGSFSNHPLVFRTNNTEQARITTAGLFQFNSGYGSAVTAYGCRAWVNFDGTVVTPSTIRGSGNVSSITRSGAGTYTVNFSTAMVDANYSVCVFPKTTTGSVSRAAFANGDAGAGGSSQLTGSYSFYTSNLAGTPSDTNYVNFAAFR